MNVALIGCGLIGGSIVLDLKEAGRIDQVIGVDNDPAHLDVAEKIKLIDRRGDYSDLFHADLIILATPVDVASQIIETILDHAGPDSIIMDVGSTKSKLCKKIESHERRGQFVATHPIAGTEFSGPEAAFAGLFNYKIALICDSQNSDAKALKLVHSIYETCGSKIVEMNPVEHDRHLAYVSHLSHISSFTLGLTVLDIEKSEKNINMLAGSGFASTVRLAKSSPEMWEPIFLQNSADLKKALDEYILHLQDFKKMIEENNGEGLKKLMRRANSITQILQMDTKDK